MTIKAVQKIIQRYRKRLKTLLGKMSPSKRAATIAGVSLVGLAVIYGIFVLSYSGRVYPRVVIGDVRLGGMKEAAVIEKLTSAAAANSSKPVTFRFQDQTSSLSPGDISWQLDPVATASKVLAIGRHDHKGWRFWEQIRSPFARTNIDPAVTFDAELLTRFLATTTNSIDQPAVNASAEYVGGNLIITHDKVGKAVNREEVQAKILSAWANFRSGEVLLETSFDAPEIIVGDEAELRTSAETLQQAKLTLTWAETTKQLTPAEITRIIGFDATGISPETSQKVLRAAFTPERIKAYVGDLANTSINRPAKDPKLVIVNGALSVAEPSVVGRTIDVEASVTAIAAALQANPADATASLTLKSVQPTINEANLAELGIKERIGYGETSFAGSPANRTHNIKNGITLLQSALIKPGDQFSTVGRLGAVDDTTGFLPELVIKENRTTPEFGGGLCQVSTTLFRSVMNAGLKVTERQNHSYRVGYYEPPVGLDATIYLPKPDFRFLNDTSAHILLQGRVVGTKVIFELWGTSDGRVSSISTPQIISTTPVGDPIYAETDTLFKGEVKQIEKPHDGAVTTATYTVTRNGQVINKQTFKSVYKVWPARFLVGTKEPPAPPTP